MATTSVLEKLDNIAKESLAKADRNMSALHLDDVIADLSRAFDAVYLMAFSAYTELADYSVSLPAILGPDAMTALRNLNLDRSALRDANAEHVAFYKLNGYTWRGLRSDWLAIPNYGEFVRYAQDGCFLDAKSARKFLAGEENKNQKGGLPKPLFSDEALSNVIRYAREHGMEGLEYWLKKGEQTVAEGYVLFPTAVPSMIREKILPYTKALDVSYPKDRVRDIIKANARNVAFDGLKTLQVCPEKLIDEVVTKARRYARQAGLGLVYRTKLYFAMKNAERRFLDV